MEKGNHTLAEKYLVLWPQRQSQYERILSELEARDYAEGASGSFLNEVGRRLLAEHKPNKTSSELSDFIMFVNSEYGNNPSDDNDLEVAFIHYLPDPRIDTEVAALLSPKVRAEVDKEWDWRSEPDGRAFVNRVLAAFPELEALTVGLTHGRENDVLTTSFTSRICYKLVKNVIANTPGELEETKQLLTHLTNEYGANSYVDFLIENSFLGMLPRTTEPGYNIVELLGPKLEAAYRKHWNIDDNQPLTNT